MAENEPKVESILFRSDIQQVHRSLDKLDHYERLRWLTAMAIVGALCMMVIVLAAATVAPGHKAGTLVVLFLAFGLAAVFAIVAFRPQMRMMKVRRETASELGVVAALETLKLVLGNSASAQNERRRLARANCDLRLTVVADGPDQRVTYYGRMRDICEHGMGAIVPAPLSAGERVSLIFTVDDQPPVTVEGVVRQRNGFRYGFEFPQLTTEQCEVIERMWVGGVDTKTIAAASVEQ
ncbi:MAG TPA: PilZ domain-containing protein [Terriglobales bacterium]|nr:PilZ domain-containing protein [Terriglobales bacterium]